MAPSFPPLWHVQTTDVDQAREAFTKMYTTVVVEPAACMPFGYTLDAAALGAVHVVRDEWTSGVRIATPAIGERYILAFSTDGIAGGMHSGEEFAMVPGRRGVVFSPQLPSSLTIEGRFCVETITIERAALDAHWTLLTGQTLRGPIRFSAEMDLTQCTGAAAYGLAQIFRREAEREATSRLVLAGLRDSLFTALLTGQFHSESQHLQAPAPKVTPGCVRRAEEYIVAHAGEPIALQDIVAVAGVPARSLQATFQTYRGTTPMAFLRDRRFELARQRLMSANTLSTVADVVRDMGLGNPGRFSVEYKKRYGESPSETLARVVERERRHSST